MTTRLIDFSDDFEPLDGPSVKKIEPLGGVLLWPAAFS
jgi:hypothetical protein